MSEDRVENQSVGVKILKLLLAILIPLVFVLTVSTLFLKLSGFNINQEASALLGKVPLLSTLVSHKQNQTSKTVGFTAQDYNKQIDDKNKQLSTLQTQVSQQQKTIADLKKQISELNLASKQAAKATQTKKKQEKANVIAMTFQNMDPQKAAAIFEKMKLQDAADDLNLLNNLTKAKIMEALSPDTAAKLTPLLAANPYQSNSKASTTSVNSIGTSSAP